MSARVYGRSHQLDHKLNAFVNKSKVFLPLTTALNSYTATSQTSIHQKQKANEFIRKMNGMPSMVRRRHDDRVFEERVTAD